MLPLHHGGKPRESPFVRKLKKRLRYKMQQCLHNQLRPASLVPCLCLVALLLFFFSASRQEDVAVVSDVPPTIDVEDAAEDKVAEVSGGHEAVLVGHSKGEGLWKERQDEVRKMFLHAWRGYSKHAFGHDEIRPENNITNDSWGGFGVTMIDGMDTMYLMGLTEEFKAVRDFVTNNLNFDKDYSASFFETTIRYLGGLLATYDLTHEDVFLDRARDLGDRLLKAFDDQTGIPYHEVNLRTGHASNPSWNHGNTMLAEMGSVQLEFKYLSYHTGDPKYAEKAQKVMDRIYDLRGATIDGLYPTFIDARTAKFSNDKVSFGGLGDSFYEYLLKQWLQTGKKEPKFRELYDAAVEGMRKHLVGRSQPRGLAFVGEMESGRRSSYFEHLVCFVPGMLALGAKDAPDPSADLALAKDLVDTCYQLYKDQPTGIAPESVVFSESGDGGDYKVSSPRYLLRPETVESLFVLYRVTKDDSYRHKAYEIFQSLEKHCRTSSSYSGLNDVTRSSPGEGFNNSMQSFFLAETLKYLFLIFGDDSVVPLDQYVFTTEGHPLSLLAPLA